MLEQLELASQADRAEPDVGPGHLDARCETHVRRMTRFMSLALRALANERRLQILDWLADPEAHFPPQVDGDLAKDGVCGLLIALKLRLSQPTVSEHLKVLAHAGLIRPKRIKQWTFYRRDEGHIRAIKKALSKI
jgi:ArsR family transcriptional regulator